MTSNAPTIPTPPTREAFLAVGDEFYEKVEHRYRNERGTFSFHRFYVLARVVEVDAATYRYETVEVLAEKDRPTNIDHPRGAPTGGTAVHWHGVFYTANLLNYDDGLAVLIRCGGPNEDPEDVIDGAFGADWTIDDLGEVAPRSAR